MPSLGRVALGGLIALSVVISGASAVGGATGEFHPTESSVGADVDLQSSRDPPERLLCPLQSPGLNSTRLSRDGSHRPAQTGAAGKDRDGTSNETSATGTVIPDVGRLGPDDRIHGLPPGVVAGLFSRDDDSRFISDREFRARYGWNRSSLATVANGSDLTFERPPRVARWWTANEFADLEPGGWNASVYPAGADLETARIDGHQVIRDAHASVFAAQPATVAHVSNETERLYLVPEGSVLGLVDYRVTLPPDRTIQPAGNESGPTSASIPPGTKRIRWCLKNATVRGIRLRQDDTVVATGEPSGYNATPVLNYSLEGRGPTTLRFEATFSVTLHRRTDRYRCQNATDRTGGRDRSCRWVHAGTRSVDTTLTVTDRINGTIYDLDPTIARVRYPDPNGGDRDRRLPAASLAGVRNRNRSSQPREGRLAVLHRSRSLLGPPRNVDRHDDRARSVAGTAGVRSRRPVDTRADGRGPGPNSDP